MANPRLAAAYAVKRNNQSQGSIPNVSSLVGGKTSSENPEPAGDYQEVDTLHRALGSAIVDKIMGARKMAKGGETGEVDSEEEGDFMSSNDPDNYDDFDDELDNEEGNDKSQYDEQTGEGGGQTPILQHIMSSLRKRSLKGR